jgi:hypothetical protein
VSTNKGNFAHTVPSTTLGDLLERILDKGVVISGDIKIKLVEVELLTIQIRLVICSVDKAKEIGIDWWRRDAHFSGLESAGQGDAGPASLGRPDRMIELEQRLARLEGGANTVEAARG